jgi:hypothetical protein
MPIYSWPSPSLMLESREEGTDMSVVARAFGFKDPTLPPPP